jgi:hypothetical protein
MLDIVKDIDKDSKDPKKRKQFDNEEKKAQLLAAE